MKALRAVKHIVIAHKYATFIMGLLIIGFGAVAAIEIIPINNSNNVSKNLTQSAQSDSVISQPNSSNSSSGSSTTPSSGSSTTTTTNISSICTSANEAANAAIASDCANYEQDLQNAQTDTANAEAIQLQEEQDQINASSLSNQTTNTSTTPTTTPSTTPTVDCSSYDSQFSSLNQQITVVKDDLANVDQTAESAGNGYGTTASQTQNLINSLTAQYDQQLSSLQQQQSNLKTEYPGC